MLRGLRLSASFLGSGSLIIRVSSQILSTWVEMKVVRSL
ncbi:hypothetical protein T12_1885 [Trichinella patagoniensis]|uniref:Uncharacterized protein n=1 Tax=Trichinella patagoniensis TaxID=990121 RepID=A0A0V0YQW6_9BILA|nr:hypothetical protein T12_1885 [Trichinella patagoniensis]